MINSIPLTGIGLFRRSLYSCLTFVVFSKQCSHLRKLSGSCPRLLPSSRVCGFGDRGPDLGRPCRPSGLRGCFSFFLWFPILLIFTLIFSISFLFISAFIWGLGAFFFSSLYRSLSHSFQTLFSDVNILNYTSPSVRTSAVYH